MIRRLIKRIRGLKVERPEEVTLHDCTLAYQMGYESVIEASQFKRFRRKRG